MNTRKLGRTGIEISEIGIGTWELSGDVWGPKDDDMSREAVRVGLESGANFIDTAAGYGAGHVEELLGGMISAGDIDRDSVVLVSKVKPRNGVFAPGPSIDIADAYDPAWIEEQALDSMKRLNTDYLDVLFMHTWSKAWDAEEAWFDTLSDLKARGLIRAIGISVPDEGASDANTHIEAGRIDVLQIVYNVFQQEPEYTTLPLAAKHDIGVIARSPFSSGVLVDEWTAETTFHSSDWRGSWPKSVKPGWLEDQAAMGDLVRDAFASHGCDLVRGALGYVLRSPAVSVVIPGSSDPTHVRENIGAADGTEVPDEVWDSVKQLWLDGKIHGTYNGSI